MLTPEQGMDVRFKDILKLFGFLVLLEVVVILLYPRSLPENNRVAFEPVAGLLFLWTYSRYGFWPSFSDFGLTKEKFLRGLKTGVLWGVGAHILSTIAGLVLPLVLGPWAEWADIPIAVPSAFWGWIGLLIQVVIFTPIVEEIIFRGVIFSTTRYKYGRRWALIITTLFFTLLHGVNPVGFVQVLIPGIAFVLLYEREGNLAAPVITHACFNLISTIAILAETLS